MSKSEISLRDIRPDYHEKEVGLDDKGKRIPEAWFSARYVIHLTIVVFTVQNDRTAVIRIIFIRQMN